MAGTTYLLPSPAATASAQEAPWIALGQMRHGIGRLLGLIAVAFVGTLLGLARNAYLYWIGTLDAAAPGAPLGAASAPTVALGEVAYGLSIAVLVLLGLFLAITGFAAWRRARRGIRESALGASPGRQDEIMRSERDARWVWYSLAGFLLGAIAGGFLVGFIDLGLAVAGMPFLSAGVAGIIVGVPASIALIFAYHHGAMHLSEALGTFATPDGRGLLNSGHDLVVAGAILGVAGVAGVMYWPLSLLTLASLGLIALGVARLAEAYDRSLPGAPTSPPAAQPSRAV